MGNTHIWAAKYLGNNLVVSSSIEGGIKIWDLEEHKCIFYDTIEPTQLCLLGAKKFAGARNGTLYVWDTETFENTATEAHGKVNCIEKLDENILVSSETVKSCCKYVHNLYFWRLDKNMKLKQRASIRNAHRYDIRCLQALPMGFLASGSTDYKVKIWNKRRKLQRRIFCEHEGNLVCMKYAEPNLLVCGTTSGSIRIWDYEIGICLKRIQEDADWITSLVVLPSGFLGCCVYGNVKFHEMSDHGIKDPEYVIDSEKTGGIRCIEPLEQNKFIAFDIGNVITFEIETSI